MKNYKIMDGNEACANAAYLFTEVCGIYPITPSSPMATLVDEWSSNGRKNLFNETVTVEEMQSEGGASALMHGSLQAGSLTTTFTASQGLLLMIPSMYKMAGEMLPGVMHVAARSLATHALSIFGDHQDIYAARSTGFAMLSSSNVQDAHYLAYVAHLSAIDASVPFLHFFDGFRTSHELNKINILNEADVLPLINFEEIKKFKERSLNLGKNITRGTSQTEDVYFQISESRNKIYNLLPDIVKRQMDKINLVAKTDYKPFNYYGSKNAEYVIVAMGSVTDTIKMVVDTLNENGEEVGLINVHLYRPFSPKYLLEVLPKSVKRIAVLDRTKECGSNGEPLYLDVCSVFKHGEVEVIGGRYGLSSKNTTPSMINAVYKNLINETPKNNFTIGIKDDVTNLSLDEEEIVCKNDYKEFKVFGYGSDGMVSGSKNVMKVLGGKDGTFVQGYFEYDSKKSGGVTIGHLRVGDSQINAPFYPTNIELLVVSKDSYLSKYDVLEGMQEGAIFLLNSEKSDEEINDLMPAKMKRKIVSKGIKFFVTNAESLASKFNLKGKTSSIISAYMLDMLGCSPEDREKFVEIVKKSLKGKDEETIKNNENVITHRADYLREYDVNKFTFEENASCDHNCAMCKMINREGSKLSVNEVYEFMDGTFEGGSSKSEKRKITEYVPVWNKENCIQCNQCAFVCPHSVVRPFLLTEEDLEKYGLTKDEVLPAVGEDNKYFYVAVSEDNCTGCGLCNFVCPGKGGNKALDFGRVDERRNAIAEKLFSEHKNESKFNKYTVKGVGYEKPGFEFSGACAGCGETPYLKLLTSLYRDEIVISNATGCSSIYGASLPCTPYSIPWINSLFEDNAEFGYGLYTSYRHVRNRIKDVMKNSLEIVNPDIKSEFIRFLENSENYEITSSVKENLIEKEIPKEIKENIDYLPARNVWIVGGDGWAYDIGYGGLDHVLRKNEKVRVLVLDTEVYSNTGGQSSKSTRVGAVAEFANDGKKTDKKDLFKVALTIPNLYVASVCLGANMNQTLKAFKEAEEHNGPSLIIAYAPCIAHGIKGGMKNSIDEEKLLVESGYTLLMRYNPDEGKLYLDSKEPDYSRYEEVFNRELRYKNLTKNNAENYEELYNANQDEAKRRYNYYKELSEKN